MCVPLHDYDHAYLFEKLLNVKSLISVYFKMSLLPTNLCSLCLQVLVIDGRGHLLGRLSAIVAKQVLLGETCLQDL